MSRLDKAGRLAVAMAVLGAAGWIVSDTLALYFTGPEIPSTHLTPEPINKKIIKNKRMDQSGWENLFGPPLPKTKRSLPEVKDKNLDITLLGIIDNKDRIGAAIIVKLDDDTQKLLRIGDSVTGSLTLASIDRQAAIVGNDSERFRLPLVDFEAIDIAENTVPKVKPHQIPTDSPPTSHEQIQSLAGLKPIEEGLAAGYRVGEGEESVKLQENFGVQKGDVILSLNGYPLGSEADDKLAASTVSKGRVKLKVRRNGETIVINLGK